MTRLYVCNFPFSTTEDELADLFSQYGDVQNCAVIRERESQKSRGFGFLEMSEAQAAEAIHNLNDSQFGGRELKVTVAHEREERPRTGGGNNRSKRRGGRDRD